MTVPPPPDSAGRDSWRHALRVALRGRLGLKATSLFIALLLWFMVKARHPVQDYVPVIIMPALDGTRMLVDPPPQLQALVVGRAVDIVKLHVDPLVIHRMVHGNAGDSLVLDFAPGDVRVPPDLADQVRVLDIQPRSATIRFGVRAARR